MAMVKEIIDNLRNDVESDEHEYVVKCLMAAVDYCREQFLDNCGEIDPLPSVKELGLSNESDKFVLLDIFLKMI